MSDQLIAPGPESKAFLLQLRSRTAPSHAALEDHVLSRSITSPAISREAYVRYLQIMGRVAAGFEETLVSLLKEAVPDIDERLKSYRADEDLLHLHTADNPYPALYFTIPGQSVAFALGGWYVMEGSTLGGRVILKSLPAGLSTATRYFEGYGTQTGPMWQRFINGLTAYAAAHSCENEIIAGSEYAFRIILGYFNQCEDDEAKGHSQS